MYLLDTCTFLWMISDPPRLSPTCRDRILDPATKLFLSAASSWEIAIKTNIGKLRLSKPASSLVPEFMERNRITGLAVEHAHALGCAELPRHHNDPFDRLLIVQAKQHDLTLLTPDPLFKPYRVPLIW